MWNLGLALQKSGQAAEAQKEFALAENCAETRRSNGWHDLYTGAQAFALHVGCGHVYSIHPEVGISRREATMIGWVVLGLLVLVVVVVAGMYNGLVRLKVQTDNAWADIDVQLKRRLRLDSEPCGDSEGIRRARKRHAGSGD